MFDNMSTIELIKVFAPIIAIQFGLAAYCILDILRKGVRNLNKVLWIVIVLFSNIIGAICYLALGRKRWQDD